MADADGSAWFYGYTPSPYRAIAPAWDRHRWTGDHGRERLDAGVPWPELTAAFTERRAEWLLYGG